MKTKDFYKLSIEESIKAIGSSLDMGLSDGEAAKRLAENGHNEFAKTKHSSLAMKFLSQFKGFMILVLIAAAIISGLVGYLNGEGFFDAVIILIIVVINAIIGVFQEAKAENALDALEKMSAPNCKVLRDGEVKVIATRDLVVGDLVVLETGDSVPADLRLVDAVNLKIQEAALTGESVPVEKTTQRIEDEASIGDRVNMAFGSCSVTYGHGKGVVTATGAASEVGKIASMIHSVPKLKTPMQKRLDKLGKVLAIVALVICGLIFLVGLLYENPLMQMFMTAVSLAAAAIPEGLPAVSTIVLAMGVQRLAQRNAIVRNLPSVETLGSTTIICSDKTGTLTINRMTVTKLYIAAKTILAQKRGNLADASIAAPGTFAPAQVLLSSIERLAQIAVMANDSIVSFKDGKQIILGDPTETALVDLAYAYEVDKCRLDTQMPRIAEIPFDSQRKLMTTVHRCCEIKSEEGPYFVAVKGGLDEILSCCTKMDINGQIMDMNSELRQNIHKSNVSMAESALRILAMAYKTIDNLPEEISPEKVEKDLIFMGTMGMIDPPREEVRNAVAECLHAGIRPVMITGDHLITASAIGRSLGIMKDGDTALTGSQVEIMSDAELIEAVRTTSIFARVAPEHKLRIVQAYQSHQNIVAMTGDGVNDAPALKLADIGIAMGITGTDVSKEASDVVLADDNFATIVAAVSEGRRIYDNLMKSIQFMISTNLGELLVLFVAVLANFVAPLLPIHILWINLVSDSFPALALSFDPAEKGIMSRKPTDSKQGIMTTGFVIRLVLQGILIGGVSLAAYFVGLQTSIDAAHTMCFATLAYSQMGLIFSIRTGMQNAFNNLFSNKFLWGAILFVIILMSVVLFVPALQRVFHVIPMTIVQWLWVIGLCIAVFLTSETVKYFCRRFQNNMTKR